MFGAPQCGHADNPFPLSVAYLHAMVLYLSFVSGHKIDYQWRRYVVILLDLEVTIGPWCTPYSPLAIVCTATSLPRVWRPRSSVTG